MVLTSKKMKLTQTFRTSLFLLIWIISGVPLFSQQLEIRYSRGTGSYMTFSEWKGYSVTWNQVFKSGSKVGISFNHSVKTKPYSWVYSTWDYEDHSEKTYIESKEPFNQRLAAEAFAGWCPLRSRNAAIYMGPSISMTWLQIHEKTHRHANQWFVDADYYNHYSMDRCYGVGVFIEFEIFQIFTERLSASIRMHSSVTGYEGSRSWAAAEPGFISWLGADFGLKWNFGKIRVIEDPLKWVSF